MPWRYSSENAGRASEPKLEYRIAKTRPISGNPCSENSVPKRTAESGRTLSHSAECASGVYIAIGSGYLDSGGRNLQITITTRHVIERVGKQWPIVALVAF